MSTIVSAGLVLAIVLASIFFGSLLGLFFWITFGHLFNWLDRNGWIP